MDANTALAVMLEKHVGSSAQVMLAQAVVLRKRNMGNISNKYRDGITKNLLPFKEVPVSQLDFMEFPPGTG